MLQHAALALSKHSLNLAALNPTKLSTFYPFT